jgi:hypothetical protein
VGSSKMTLEIPNGVVIFFPVFLKPNFSISFFKLKNKIKLFFKKIKIFIL